MVESTPTSFIRRYERPAREYGPFAFECDAFRQRYDDCLYLPMNHDELYVRFRGGLAGAPRVHPDRPLQQRGEPDTSGR